MKIPVKHILPVGLMLLLLMVLAVKHATAQIVVTEDFNYPTGTLGGQWAAQCSGALVNVKSPGLAYSGYLGSGIGNAAYLVASGSEYKLTSNFSIAGPVYMVFLVNVESVQTGGGATCSQGNDYVVAFRASGGAGQNFNNHTGMMF